MINADGFFKVIMVDADARFWQICRAVRLKPQQAPSSEVACERHLITFERTTERMPDGMVIYREI